jgi:DNA adenine methylase
MIKLRQIRYDAVWMRVPHPIPYQGSKRALAPLILKYFPADTKHLIEPFCGAGAITLAASLHNRAKTFSMNDINAPLMALWDRIINAPEDIADAYAKMWNAQLGNERKYYNQVREEFNKTKRPELLLYLLLRCVKAAVRYNSDGDFNQSPDNRRLGMRPDTLRRHILVASNLLKGKTKLQSKDYRDILAEAEGKDLVYMDPPYQGVCKNRDNRYFGTFDSAEFITSLAELNRRGISYILSYDGRTGNRVYGKPMPESLELTHLEIEVGRSSQATLNGEEHVTVESIYLSPALSHRLGGVKKAQLTAAPKQHNLLDCQTNLENCQERLSNV